VDLPNKDPAPTPTAPSRPKVEAVIPGAVASKRPATRRFLGFLFAESPKDIGKKITDDIIVPRLKLSFFEAFNGFLSGMLWGNSGVTPPQGLMRGTTIHGGTDYRVISSGGQPVISGLTQARQEQVHQVTSVGAYRDLVCPTQHHAELLLAAIIDIHNQYRMVTVADLYEAANKTPEPGAGNYGWTSVDTARIVKDREGFRLELPRPVLL